MVSIETSFSGSTKNLAIIDSLVIHHSNAGSL